MKTARKESEIKGEQTGKWNETERKQAGKTHIAVFDGIRGLAALVVMAYHLSVWSPEGYAANALTSFSNPIWEVMTKTPLKLLWGGNEAVLVFYVIGGFVLAMPYIQGRKLRFRSFLLRRGVRLMLPYLIILMITLICSFFFGELKNEVRLSGAFNVKWSRFPSLAEIILYYAGYDYNLSIVAGAFWSLIQEWRMSFVLPFVGMALCRFSTKRVVAVSLLARWGVRECLQLSARANDIDWLDHLLRSLDRTAFNFLFFLLGAVLAKHLVQMRAVVRERKTVRLLTAGIVPLLLSVKWLLNGAGIGVTWRAIAPVIALGVVGFLLLAMESPRMTAFFQSKPLLFLGKHSFSLYLTHTTAIVLFVTVFSRVLTPTTALLLSPAFAFAVAILWRKTVEAGCGKLLRYIK